MFASRDGCGRKLAYLLISQPAAESVFRTFYVLARASSSYFRISTPVCRVSPFLDHHVLRRTQLWDDKTIACSTTTTQMHVSLSSTRFGLLGRQNHADCADFVPLVVSGRLGGVSVSANAVPWNDFVTSWDPEGWAGGKNL